MRDNRIRMKGFSLIELVLTLAILLIVLQVVYSVFFVGHKSYVVSTNKGFAQQGVRIGNLFISDVLEYATGLDVDGSTDFQTPYYTLRYNNISQELIWEKYDYTTNLSMESKKTSGKWDKILVSNSIPGKLNITMTQIESNGGTESQYKLDFDIELLNIPDLRTDKVWDLVAGEVLYYTKNEPRSFGSVNVEWENENTSGGNSTSLQWGDEADIVIEKRKKNETEYTPATYNYEKKGYEIGTNSIIRYKLSYYNIDEETVTITANSQIINPTLVDVGTGKYEITGEHTPTNSIEYIVINIQGQDADSSGSIYKSIKLIK